VFFVGKKDEEKHIVMDYRRLNKQTIKNNYSLSLITDLVDSMDVMICFDTYLFLY